MAASLDQGFELFANWQTLVVGLTIYVMTAAIRRVVETGWKGSKTNKWWYEVLLPLGPIGNGIILAVGMKKFPWPEQVAASTSARVTYAIVCGLFCGWLYARVRGFLRSQTEEGKKKDDGSNPGISLPPVALTSTPAPAVVEEPTPAPVTTPEKPSDASTP